MECLTAQNLSDFKTLLNTVPSLINTLSDTTQHFTILAVLNDPSSGYAKGLLDSDVTTHFNALSRQIINGSVAGNDLSQGSVYHSLLSSDNVIVTEVEARRGRADTVSIRVKMSSLHVYDHIASISFYLRPGFRRRSASVEQGRVRRY